MTGSNDAAARPGAKRKVWPWVLGGFAGLALIGALSDPQAGKPQPRDPSRPDQAKVADLKDAMKPLGRGGADFALAIPANVAAVDVETAARARCDGLAICGVHGWTDPAQVAHAWPLLDREVAALSFRYALNRNTGLERVQWFCGSPGAPAQGACERPGG